MTRKHNKTKKPIPETMPDISRTGDVITNDFNLIGDKIPPISTIRTQLRSAKSLIDTSYTIPVITEFDRLRIALNLDLHGERVEFDEWGMENVPNPTVSPKFMKAEELRTEQRREANFVNPFDEDDDSENDLSDLWDDNDFIDDVAPENVENIVETNEEDETVDTHESDVIHDRAVKKRIRYSTYKTTVGLFNMFICNGFFVVDLSGKWMADDGILGSLHRDNIREALERVLDLGVVEFDIEEFINCAQVFVCDVCVDIPLENKTQVSRYIDGVSSFFPIATNRFNITKYGRHGLALKPKAKSSGYSFVIYSKGQELDYSVKKRTRATRYTDIIGDTGIELAERTLRLEVKLFKLKNIRSGLNIATPAEGFVRLTDVLNSTAPVMLQMFELFSGNPTELLDRLEWLNTISTAPEGFTLSEIFTAERFVELLRENNFDLTLTKSHIRTEYINATDTELEYFNRLSNLRQNVLNFLVYRKPKSITVMLALLARLQAYYSTGMGVDNG